MQDLTPPCAPFARAQYRDAILEYGNVLRLDGGHAQAIRQLGRAHYELGELGQAFRYLLRAHEQEPGNAEVRVRLGTIYLVGRQPAEARRHAAAVLEREPRHFEALLLLAGAVSNAGETEAALRALEAAAQEFAGRARFDMAVATLAMRQQDWPRAEGAFTEAVAREPGSVEEHMARGNFHATRGDAPRAEAALRRAAELAPMGSPARLRLAEFLARTGRGEEGKRLLAEITRKAPNYLPAWRRIAERGRC